MHSVCLSVSDAGMQAFDRRTLYSKGNSVGSSWLGALPNVYKQTQTQVAVDRQRCRLVDSQTAAAQVCKSSHDHEHSRYVQCMVLYSNTRNDLQDNHSDTTVVMEFAGYGMQDNHSAPASCSTSPPEGCKVNEDVSCSVSLDGCWGAADSRATAS